MGRPRKQQKQADQSACIKDMVMLPTKERHDTNPGGENLSIFCHFFIVVLSGAMGIPSSRTQ